MCCRCHSPFRTVFRFMLGTLLLVLVVSGLSWVVTEVLPAIAPFLLVGVLTAGVFWVVHRLRGT